MLKAVVELAARIPPPAPLAPGGRAAARKPGGAAKVLRLTSYVLPIPKL